jgi:hypothetical protein
LPGDTNSSTGEAALAEAGATARAKAAIDAKAQTYIPLSSPTRDRRDST